MKLEELAMSAVTAINRKSVLGINIEGDAHVTLQMPPQKQERRHRYLAGRNSPRGDVLSRMGDYDVVTFVALDVLAWCIANSNGQIKIDHPAPA